MDQYQLERVWIEYQQNIASLRRIVPPLLMTAFESRQQHTFTVDEGLPAIQAHRLVIGPTQGAPNGIPDLLPSYFVGRIVSLHAAGLILLVTNSTVQRLARDLGQGEGFRFEAGATLKTGSSVGARCAVALYAGANHFRHIDEWADDAAHWDDPKDDDQRRRHMAQRRSMTVIAAVLGETLPIRQNFCYEIVEALFGDDRQYREFEGHLLRIGQDAMRTAGLPEPTIGITVTEVRSISDEGKLPTGSYVKMSGIMRAAD